MCNANKRFMNLKERRSPTAVFLYFFKKKKLVNFKAKKGVQYPRPAVSVFSFSLQANENEKLIVTFGTRNARPLHLPLI